MTAFLAFVSIGPVGVLFSNLVPACRPGFLFVTRFPFHPLPVHQSRQRPIALVVVGRTRNAFPSLHPAWALLILWYSTELSRWMRALCAVFLVATVVVTLELGEHYFVDLVAGFRLALAIYATCALNLAISDGRRRFAMLAGLALTGG